MLIRALEVSASAAARPAVRAVIPAGAHQTSWQIMGRYAAALQILGIDSVISAKGSSAPGLSTAPGGDPAAEGLGKLAAFFEQEFRTAKSTHPGITDANARHIAQYETIVAHRSEFPPGEFYIHTELGDGASITTQIPAIPTPTVSVAAISISAISAVMPAGAAQAAVSIVSAKAFYAEWG